MVATGVSSTTRQPWRRYEVQPDYYMVGGVVMRENKPIKWFAKGTPDGDLGLKKGDKIFLSGKYKNADMFNGVDRGDMLGDVRVLSEQAFKDATGYPGGKREGGGEVPPPEAQPEAEAKPVPDAPGTPAQEPGKTPANTPSEKPPCVEKVDALLETISGFKPKREDLIDAVKAKVKELLPEQAAMLHELKGAWTALTDVIVQSHMENPLEAQRKHLFFRVHEAVRQVQGSQDDEQARDIAMKQVPEMNMTKARPLSPRAFLSMGQALLDHAITMVDMASESVGQASPVMDFGNVSAQVETAPGKTETIELKPLFGQNDMDQGVDHVEAIIGSLNAEMDRARQAEAQEIPEFDHNVASIPKTSNVLMGKDAILNVLSEIAAKMTEANTQINEVLQKLPEFEELKKLSRSIPMAFERLDLMRWECPSERARIDKEKVYRLSVIRTGGRGYPENTQPTSASWVLRNCKWASSR